jgi:hypothetical protein
MHKKPPLLAGFPFSDVAFDFLTGAFTDIALYATGMLIKPVQFKPAKRATEHTRHSS